MERFRRASFELFKRTPDECYDSLGSMWKFLHDRKEVSEELWEPPSNIYTGLQDGYLWLGIGELHLPMTNWAFSQLCQICRVDRRTVNRLSGATADQVFAETLPEGSKPMQVFQSEGIVRSMHGVGYTRLYDVEVLQTVQEFATDFQAPPVGLNGNTGLYAGEEDMFLFLIDPKGEITINNETFFSGFFVWNSEVGKRSLGIEAFWCQEVCSNHIVHHAVDVQMVDETQTHRWHS